MGIIMRKLLRIIFIIIPLLIIAYLVECYKLKYEQRMLLKDEHEEKLYLQSGQFSSSIKTSQNITNPPESIVIGPNTSVSSQNSIAIGHDDPYYTPIWCGTPVSSLKNGHLYNICRARQRGEWESGKPVTAPSYLLDAVEREFCRRGYTPGMMNKVIEDQNRAFRENYRARKRS